MITTGPAAAHRRLPLHQELYLFAHDQNGTPAIHLPSLSVGLGGAALLDLALLERLTVIGGRIVVQRNQTAGEPILDSVLSAIAASTGSRELLFWLRALSGTIYERATGSLVAAGLLTPTVKKRLRGSTYKYRPADATHAQVACARMRWATYGHEYPDPQCAALCGLTAVLRLERGLHLDESTGEILQRLRHLSRAHFAPGAEVITAVEGLVAEVAMSVYR